MNDVVLLVSNEFKQAVQMVQETKDDFPTIWIQTEYIVEVLGFLKNKV
jgi:hypothetical protein